MTNAGSLKRVLLTGATGLVGRFVLAELLRRRIPTTVIVRSRARTSAVERVEQALAHFERDQFLPRPRIVEGDLSAPGLGIVADELAYLQYESVAIVHCAASIRFIADDASGEPFQSNVEGTQRLLELCQRLPVASFHYVSTAYTQSRREIYPVAFEVAVARDAPAGNDYERSKILAEALIRQCAWLPSRTFLRPSIVVGDSRTAYTPSFHGFYSALQVGRQISQVLGGDPAAGPWFREQLGLVEQDAKNIVPVDWVAAAIVHVLARPELHGQTYHLTNPNPVSAIDMQSAIVDSLHEEWIGTHGESSRDNAGAPPRESHFREQMRVYDAYFGDDPVFDRARAGAALRTLPCPEVNYALLRKLATFALQTNFGWPKSQPTPSPLNGWFRVNTGQQGAAGQAAAEDECVLELVGPGATHPMRFQKVADKWFFESFLEKSDSNKSCMVTSTDVLADCLIGKLDPGRCLELGRWVIRSGNRRNWLALVRKMVHDVRLSMPASIAANGNAHAAENRKDL